MFALNKPALLTAGQILNQQCHSAAVEAVRLHTAPAAKASAAPGVEDLITSAISALATASAAFRAKSTSTKQGLDGEEITPLESNLAAAVAHIFHLADAYKLELGAALAVHLSHETCPF
jgi:hypothetical protein